MIKRYFLFFIIGFSPGVYLIASNLLSEDTPMANELTRMKYLERFVKYRCKLNPDDFFARRIDKDKENQCNDLYYSRMENLLIEGYDLSDTDQRRVAKLCEIEGCQSLVKIEKAIIKYRQSQKR